MFGWRTMDAVRASRSKRARTPLELRHLSRMILMATA